ncbi:MAG: phage/plasmid primase, P4 family [Gaiellaceae bacterium]
MTVWEEIASPIGPEPEPVIGLSVLNNTEVGNAEQLVTRHGRRLRYCGPWSKWLVYDGARWAKDRSGAPVRLQKETLRWATANANAILDDKPRVARLKFLLESEREARIRAAIALAAPELPVMPEEFDLDPWILNLTNGTLDLRTVQLRRHRPDDLLTKLAPVTFDPEATAPHWESSLARWLQDDRLLQDYVQQIVGYSLTGDTREQLLFILYGAGENGKSTFLRILLELLGDYAQQTPTATFLDRRGDAIPNDLAALRGTRLVSAAESGESRKLNEALVKQMTGGDRISARFMRSEYFEFTPAFKPWLATNHKPLIRGTDHAIWRRLRLIPFTARITPEERDPELLDKLRLELPGILNWALVGCLAWHGHGLQTPRSVEDATSAYRAEMDDVGRFLEDRCELADGLTTTSVALFTAYNHWASGNGEQALTQNAFSRRLSERGLVHKRFTGGTRGWSGIGLGHRRRRNDASGRNRESSAAENGLSQ